MARALVFPLAEEHSAICVSKVSGDGAETIGAVAHLLLDNFLCMVVAVEQRQRHTQSPYVASSEAFCAGQAQISKRRIAYFNPSIAHQCLCRSNPVDSLLKQAACNYRAIAIAPPCLRSVCWQVTGPKARSRANQPGDHVG
jgi:hypothetical protein